MNRSPVASRDQWVIFYLVLHLDFKKSEYGHFQWCSSVCESSETQTAWETHSYNVLAILPFFLHFFNWKYYLIDMYIKKQLKNVFLLTLKNWAVHIPLLLNTYYVVFREQGSLMKHSKKTPPPSPRLKPNCQNHTCSRQSLCYIDSYLLVQSLLKLCLVLAGRTCRSLIQPAFLESACKAPTQTPATGLFAKGGWTSGLMAIFSGWWEEGHSEPLQWVIWLISPRAA